MRRFVRPSLRWGFILSVCLSRRGDHRFYRPSPRVFSSNEITRVFYCAMPHDLGYSNR